MILSIYAGDLSPWRINLLLKQAVVEITPAAKHIITLDLFNRMLNTLVKNKLTWQLLRPIAKAGRILSQRRNMVVSAHAHTGPLHFAYLFKDLKTLHGPFKGLKYPSLDSVGSMIYPKLLGSYERELHPVVEQCLATDYSEVLDVGCAEGYYAVGFALRNKAKIYAYDTSESARNACAEMAKLNGVDIVIKSFCSAGELKNFPFTGKGLIICDCEGFEIELFTENSIQNLGNCDLLIETHDSINIEISTKLAELFSSTHDIKVIKSVDDIEKAKTYKYPETEGLDLTAKREIYGEYRQRIMEWFFCTPKVK